MWSRERSYHCIAVFLGRWFLFSIRFSITFAILIRILRNFPIGIGNGTNTTHDIELESEVGFIRNSSQVDNDWMTCQQCQEQKHELLNHVRSGDKSVQRGT